MLRTKKVQPADEHDCESGPNFRMGQAQILKGRQRTDGGGHDVIRDQQERADDGDDFRPVPDAGIDPAAVRIMFADGHVVDPHQGGEQTHGRDQPKRTVTRHGKRQADDVGLAGTPIPVKNGGGARRVHVAWPLRLTENHPRSLITPVVL